MSTPRLLPLAALLLMLLLPASAGSQGTGHAALQPQGPGRVLVVSAPPARARVSFVPPAGTVEVCIIKLRNAVIGEPVLMGCFPATPGRRQEQLVPVGPSLDYAQVVRHGDRLEVQAYNRDRAITDLGVARLQYRLYDPWAPK